MKLQVLILLVIAVGIAWWLLGARLRHFRTRLARGLRVGGVLYLALVAARLATSPLDQEQLQVVGLSLLFFAGLWVAAWLATRVMSKD